MQKDAIIYNDIISLLEKGIISKNGNPIGWDELTHRTSPWNNRCMICIGNNF